MAYLPFAVFVVVLLCILLPEIPSDLKLPVTVYALVIGTMVGAAWSKCINGNKWDTNKLMGAIGALIFVVSDTIIAVNKFYFPFDSAKTWVMITYYLGQTLIAASTHLNVSSKMKLK